MHRIAAMLGMLLGGCWVNIEHAPCEHYLGYPFELARKDLVGTGVHHGIGTHLSSWNVPLCGADAGGVGVEGPSHGYTCPGGSSSEVICDEFWHPSSETWGCALLHRKDTGTVCFVDEYP